MGFVPNLDSSLVADFNVMAEPSGGDVVAKRLVCREICRVSECLANLVQLGNMMRTSGKGWGVRR